MKDPDGAIQDYCRAVELNPRDAVAYNNRGLIYHDRNEMDKALADYSQAISIDAANPIFFENRALVYMSKGMIDQAKQDYDYALKHATDEAHRSSLMEKRSTTANGDDRSRQSNSGAAHELPDSGGGSSDVSGHQRVRNP